MYPDISLEYPYIRIPYEAGVKLFKSTKKHVEKEMSAVLNSIVALKKDPNTTKDIAITSLRALLTRLQGLKKKLDENYHEEEQVYECTKKRLKQLNAIANNNNSTNGNGNIVDKQVCITYHKTRTNRLIMDHLLRNDCIHTAQKIADEYGLNDFMNIDGKIIGEYRKIIKDLKNKSCESALKWCQVYKSKLSRNNSQLEFKLIFQEFIELVRKHDIVGALAYIKKHSENFQENHLNEISKAMGCLTFYKIIDKLPQYEVYFNEQRWDELIELFKKDSFLIMGITKQSQLEVSLQSGLSSLKTINCFEENLMKTHVCPVCNPNMQKLAQNVPSTHKIISSLICRITGEVMDEHNPPCALPNGQVYSLKAIKSMADKNDGKVICPITKKEFTFSQDIENNDNTQYENLLNSVANEVFCLFKGQLPEEYQIQEAPMNINTSLTDRELNHLVNQLLKAEKEIEEDEKTYNFEFLLNDDFIKGSLKSHILKHKLNGEKTLTIYYTFALEKPELTKTIEEEDWIWCISKFISVPAEKNIYAAGFFNGSISIFNHEDKKTGSFTLSEQGIRCILGHSLVGDKSNRVFVGTADEQLIISDLSFGKKKCSLKTVGIGKGHQSSVESIDIHPLNASKVCTGDFDGDIKIWDIDFPIENANKQEENETTNKKLKIAPKVLEPTSSDNIHKESITRIIWIRPETIATSSQDHTIKFYDLNQRKETNHLYCKDNVVTSFAYQNNIIVSTHEDGIIKQWDERKDSKHPIKIIKGHSKWVSDVKFHPNNPLIYLTSSYDATVKIWDMRSNFPLNTFKDQKSKIFSVEWNGDDYFITGGSSSKIMVYKFKN